MADARSTQRGMFLHSGSLMAQRDGPPRYEVQLPSQPAPAAQPDPTAYASLLPSVPAAELRATVVPVSTKLEVGEKPAPLLLIHDRRRGDPWQQNQQATMLTISLANGFGMEVFGPALVLFAEPGRDLSGSYYDTLDDLIQNEVLGKFEDGEQPTEQDWRFWGEAFQLMLEDRAGETHD
ncbi:hypothetical protein C2E21_0768 [Chlorella sorokiniana]|uniref:Uncharacterized protein n=1 Tax=Chlorella sorokiniana TaxID=3076 RepID=A0A2P6U2T2_CHLSO|nr:hypothetical protein C2E21_0768 [Chlorella sorokiniana]|eukprot:PRW60612.1 hypothetical protein C2E21_0768 [Chlorella sorokiniana]